MSPAARPAPIGTFLAATSSETSKSAVPVGAVESVVLLEANALRVNGEGWVVNNSATDMLYISLGGTAVVTDIPVAPGATLGFNHYTGPVSAIRATGTDVATGGEFLP